MVLVVVVSVVDVVVLEVVVSVVVDVVVLVVVDALVLESGVLICLIYPEMILRRSQSV